MLLNMHALITNVLKKLAYLSCYEVRTLILSTEEFYPPKAQKIFVDDSDNLPLWRPLLNESNRKYITAYRSSLFVLENNACQSPQTTAQNLF